MTAPAATTFVAAASGTPRPALQWQLSLNGSSWSDIAGATSSSYAVAATAVGDNGRQFRVVATNSAGSASSNAATLTVTAAPMPAVASAKIAAGEEHTCAIRNNGSLACFGYNSSGQMGNGTFTAATTPTTVPLPEATVAVAAGYNSTCAIGTSGTLRCWGGLMGSLRTPEVVAGNNGIDVGGGGIRAVTVGRLHACLLTVSGRVWCWGSNSLGQLGNASNLYSATPVLVQGAVGVLLNDVVSISASDWQTCALFNTGSVMCWGQDLASSQSIAIRIGALPAATQVSGSCALLADRTVRCWNGISNTIPTAIAGLADVSLIGYGAPNCAVQAGGIVQCWFAGGAVNAPVYAVREPPAPVAGLGGVGALATGGSHTCALRTDAALLCWGSGRYGQLGLGDIAGRTTPAALPHSIGWAMP